MKKSKLNTSQSLFYIVLTAMFAALTTVATSFIKFPTVCGYAHAGDSIIYLTACTLPAPYSFISAGIGGGLADLLAGYPQWSVPTLIIKMLNVLPFVVARYYLKKKDKDDAIINKLTILMTLPSWFVTFAGYYIANSLFYDWKTAIFDVPTYVVQPLVSAIIFILLGVALDKINFKNKIINS